MREQGSIVFLLSSWRITQIQDERLEGGGPGQKSDKKKRPIRAFVASEGCKGRGAGKEAEKRTKEEAKEEDQGRGSRKGARSIAR